jgi:23S rRNA (adenine2503-C2)-methyltransferase
MSARDALQAYRPDLAALLAEDDYPPYRYAQVYGHLMHHPVTPFSRATALSKDFREALGSEGASVLRLLKRTDDRDGTTKLLLANTDGSSVETVVMRYPRRNTVCISTQVGCSLGCAFCVTGSIRFRRNLTVAEIVDQVREVRALLAEEGSNLHNVVLMGMGEPLLNLDAVLTSIRILKDPRGLGLAQRSLSVSTVGIPAGIRRLAEEEPQVNLAISLHAADDALRTRLVPANRRYPLAEVMKAADDHFRLTHRKLFVEYVLLGGVNDSEKQAQKLADLLRRRVVAVNLIPWNPGQGEFRVPTPAAVAAFQAVLSGRGFEVTVRESKGQRIEAACGQLAAGATRRRGERVSGGRATSPRSREGR